MSLHWSEEEFRAHQARQRDVQRVREGQMAEGRPVTEKVFMAAVVRLAKEEGYMAYHTWSSKRSPEGFPDIVLAKAGSSLYAVELKINTGQVTPAQHAWLAALAGSTGVVAECWRPSMLDAIMAQLRR